jgi:cysteine desulfurase
VAGVFHPRRPTCFFVERRVGCWYDRSVGCSGIYLDYNATTPVDPDVFEAMRPYFCELFGNAASRSHEPGRQALRAVEKARTQVASLLNCPGEGVIFTSGATEADNLALKGIVRASGRRHIITQATEHKAVLDPCHRLEEEGFELTVLPVDATGLVDPDDVRRALRPDTAIVSIMFANNETGTLQPVREIGRITRAAGVPFHCDATQAVGRVTVDMRADFIDLLSLSGHKLYGPKGVGALCMSCAAPGRLKGEIDGGGHERGCRSGTLNVPGIVGLGKACEIACLVMETDAAKAARMRNTFESAISSRLEGVHIHGHPTLRLPNTTNLRIDGIDCESLLLELPELCFSSGSACSSACGGPSHVLSAMGIDPLAAFGSMRISLGRPTTESQVEQAIEQLCAAATRLREMLGTF